MFPRVRKLNKNATTYEYLVFSESIYEKGKGSSTRNIANLGNIKNFKTKDIHNLIGGLIKIFKLEKYALADDVEIKESLEHGSIMLWQKIWEELGISEMIKNYVRQKDKRIKLAVEKYIEIMTVNRCVDPLSKLGGTRWVERTCYKEMKGYNGLDLEVNNFYRSMDHLLDIKDALESSIYERLRNLFSINVKMTFYDITSTFFYTENCPIGENGYSRDNMPDKEQIIVGVVTSYEGYPIKHYVFEGNTKDETTVQAVIKDLRKEFNIEETIFVGDRGMITKLNLQRIIEEGYDYIMGVKVRQDEIYQMLLGEGGIKDEDFEGEYNDLKIKEEKVRVKEFLLWKTKEIMDGDKVKPANDKFGVLEKKINALTNKDEPDYEDYKTIIGEIAPGVDSKICRKIFRVIKRYKGKYEDELRYIICLNKERKKASREKRDKYILRLSKELDKIFEEGRKKEDIISIERSINKTFEGYKRRYRKLFEIDRDKESNIANGYKLNKKAIEEEKMLDGIFVLLTNRHDVDIIKVVESFKYLREVEILFDDFKNFVDVRPVRHWLEKRVRSHVFICILALLLKRIFEINYLGGKATTEPIEEISKSKLIKYKVKFSENENRSKIIHKVTNTSPLQKQYFNMVGIKNPQSLEKFI